MVYLYIVSKSMNSDFNEQPETMEPYWNPRGVCVNHLHHENATSDPIHPMEELFTPMQQTHFRKFNIFSVSY